MKGKFITFEGGEGVGKSTQVSKLMEYLNNSGQKAILVRQPGGTPISEKIRKIILDKANSEMSAECEALLYASARAQLMSEVIKPALNKGIIVVCDRHLDSSLAYQGYARGLGIDNIFEINKMAVYDCHPDVTIFIDLPPEKTFRSREKSQEMNDRLEVESMGFHKLVYDGFVKLANNSNGRIVKVKPCSNKQDTFSKILRILQEKEVIK